MTGVQEFDEEASDSTGTGADGEGCCRVRTSAMGDRND